jgi:uncharacterized membrane protein YraQ (UPF0718 family)
MNEKREKKGGGNHMLTTTIIMGVIAIILSSIAYQQGGGGHIKGLGIGGKMLINIFPLLIFAFIIAGMSQTLLSTVNIAGWVGEESGLKGIVIGTFAGSIVTGGPFVCLPMALAFSKAGAGIGTVVAFISGWALLSLPRIPMEVGILGWKIAAIRYATTFLFAPVAGIIAQLVFGEKST